MRADPELHRRLPALAELRLIALDLDGTVLSPDGAVSGRTSRAVRAVLELGVAVTPVTARLPVAALHPSLRLGLRGEAICASGAARMDLRTGRLSDQQRLPGEQAREAARRIRRACPYVTFGWADDTGVTVEAGYPYPHPDRTVGALDTLADAVITLFGQCQGPCAADLAAQARLAAAGVADLGRHDAPSHDAPSHDAPSHGGTAPGYVELVRPGVDKLAALRRFCAERGVTSSQVLAFGNDATDAAMLRWAGHGVAVADSDSAALAAADSISGSCQDDGVAVILERLVAVSR